MEAKVNIKKLKDENIAETLYWLYPSHLLYHEAEEEQLTSKKMVFVGCCVNCSVYDMIEAIEMSGGDAASLDIRLQFRFHDFDGVIEDVWLDCPLLEAQEEMEQIFDFAIDPVTNHWARLTQNSE